MSQRFNFFGVASNLLKIDGCWSDRDITILEQQLAVCTNWFPITCAYRWEGRIVEKAETVLIVKTQAEYREEIKQVIHEHITYTNCIAEIALESINDSFLNWLNVEVPKKLLSKATVGS